jgi:hypothetical protein
MTIQAPVKAIAHPLFAVIASMPNTYQPPERFTDKVYSEKVIYDHNPIKLSIIKLSVNLNSTGIQVHSSPTLYADILQSSLKRPVAWPGAVTNAPGAGGFIALTSTRVPSILAGCDSKAMGDKERVPKTRFVCMVKSLPGTTMLLECDFFPSFFEYCRIGVRPLDFRRRG